MVKQNGNTETQYKEPLARSELAVIQPLWPSVELLIYEILLRVLDWLFKIWSAKPDCRFVFYNQKFVIKLL